MVADILAALATCWNNHHSQCLQSNRKQLHIEKVDLSSSSSTGVYCTLVLNRGLSNSLSDERNCSRTLSQNYMTKAYCKFHVPFINSEFTMPRLLASPISLFQFVTFAIIAIMTTQILSANAFRTIDFGQTGDDQEVQHCIDANGTLHGLFSTWTERETCHCTCYPTAGIAVSICDGCTVNSTVNQVMTPDKDDSHGEGNANGIRQSCLYSLTGVVYKHADIWMSAQIPCVKCRCDDGQVRCTGEPHHCPPLCLPGQQMLPPGPCCETTCSGKALQNMTYTFANCTHPVTVLSVVHGDFITLNGTCVDQKCLCVNGRWVCSDYCLPIEQLHCSRKELVIWDPFCCPRCPGKSGCEVLVDQKQWNRPNTTELMGNLTQNAVLFPSRMEHSFSSAPIGSEVNLTKATIPPGAEVALPQGYCFCLNSSILCPRPGRHIWHDGDCYYVDNHEGTYYAPHAHWIPQSDPCTECQCLENRIYSCQPRKCDVYFVCEPGERPIVRPGECCPSYCGKVEDTNEITKAALGRLKQPIYPSEDEPRTENFVPTTSKTKNDTQTHPRKPEFGQGGCPSFDNLDTLAEATTFPTGSTLILSRTCRHLLCVCTTSNRWVCTDHCPPCTETLESMETTGTIERPPPPGRCCPVCENEFTSSRLMWPQLGYKENENRQRWPSRPWEDTDRNRFLEPADWSLNRLIYKDQQHYLGGISNHRRSDIEQTIKIYVTAASLCLFILLGVPMGTFIAWYFINRRRRLYRRQTVRSQAYRKRLAHFNMGTVKRHVYHTTNSSSRPLRSSNDTASPNTISSADHESTYGPTSQLHNYEPNYPVETSSPDEVIHSSEKRGLDRNQFRFKPVQGPLRKVSKANESKSEPPSPIASKSLWNGQSASMRSKSREYISPVTVNSGTDGHNVTQKLQCEKNPKAVRRVTSSLAAVKCPTPDLVPRHQTVTRCNTWLNGARKYTLQKLLPHSTNEKPLTQEPNDITSCHAIPLVNRKPSLPAPSYRTSDRETNGVQANGLKVLMGSTKTHKTKSGIGIRHVKSDVTDRESVTHYFLPVGLTRKSSLKTYRVRERNVSKSPETDITSFTDSQTITAQRKQIRIDGYKHNSTQDGTHEQTQEDTPEVDTEEACLQDMYRTWPRSNQSHTDENRTNKRDPHAASIDIFTKHSHLKGTEYRDEHFNADVNGK